MRIFCNKPEKLILRSLEDVMHCGSKDKSCAEGGLYGRIKVWRRKLRLQ